MYRTRKEDCHILQSHCNLKIPPKSCNRGRRNSRRMYRASLVCHYSHMLLGNVTEMHSIVFWVIAFWSNCLEIQWFAKTHFTQSYHFWEGNVPAVNGIIQCLCRMNNVKGHSWEPAKLDITQMGVYWDNLDTEGISLPNTPPLCRAKAYLTQPMHLMVFTPIATSFNHAAYSMLWIEMR